MKALILYIGLCLIYLVLYSPFVLIPLILVLGVALLNINILSSISVIIFMICFVLTSIRVGIRTRYSIFLMLKEGKGFMETIKESEILVKQRLKGFFRIERAGKTT